MELRLQEGEFKKRLSTIPQLQEIKTARHLYLIASAPLFCLPEATRRPEGPP
jgi:hypothetical protein